jgi:hypothetical protein
MGTLLRQTKQDELKVLLNPSAIGDFTRTALAADAPRSNMEEAKGPRRPHSDHSLSQECCDMHERQQCESRGAAP